MNNETCPHCKAEIDQYPHNHQYICETLINNAYYRTAKCYECQIEQLQNALNKINALLPQVDSDGNLFTAYIDSDGDVEFGSVNAGALITEIAAIITEARGEVK